MLPSPRFTPNRTTEEARTAPRKRILHVSGVRNLRFPVGLVRLNARAIDGQSSILYESFYL